MIKNSSVRDIIKVGYSFLNKTNVLDNIVDYTADEWQMLVERSTFHRIVIPLSEFVKRNHITVPEEQKASLQKETHKVSVRMLSLATEIVNLSRDFNQKNRPFIFLKGPVLCKQIYGDFITKDSRDIDLLIQESEIDYFTKILIKRGYKLLYPYRSLNGKQKLYFRKYNNQLSFYNSATKIQVEIHWRLFANKHLLTLSFNEIVENSSKLKVATEELLVFSADQLILYLCIHGAKHKWYKLYWLLELSFLLKSKTIDYTKLIELANEKDVMRPLIQGLYLSKLLFATHFPDDLQKVYEKDAVLKSLVSEVHEGLLSGKEDDSKEKSVKNYIKSLQYKMKLKRDLKYKLSYFQFVSIQDFLLLPLPSYLFIFYFPLRPLLWVWRYLIPTKN